MARELNLSMLSTSWFGDFLSPAYTPAVALSLVSIPLRICARALARARALTRAWMDPCVSLVQRSGQMKRSYSQSNRRTKEGWRAQSIAKSFGVICVPHLLLVWRDRFAKAVARLAKNCEWAKERLGKPRKDVLVKAQETLMTIFVDSFYR